MIVQKIVINLNMRLHELDIPQPKGKTATSVEEAVEIAEEIGYPVLVRPSYVLGGRAMEIVYQQEELTTLYEKCSKSKSRTSSIN